MAIVIALSIFLLLDFIPVRFAKKLDRVSMDEAIVCIPDFKTGLWEYNWSIPGHHTLVSFTEDSKNPFEVLNKKDFEMFHVFNVTSMKFIFYGEVIDESIEQGTRLILFQAEKWDAVYPIERKKSFRGIYVSKRYFTMYDYCWLSFLEKLFS